MLLLSSISCWWFCLLSPLWGLFMGRSQYLNKVFFFSKHIMIYHFKYSTIHDPGKFSYTSVVDVMCWLLSFIARLSKTSTVSSWVARNKNLGWWFTWSTDPQQQWTPGNIDKERFKRKLESVPSFVQIRCCFPVPVPVTNLSVNLGMNSSVLCSRRRHLAAVMYMYISSSARQHVTHTYGFRCNRLHFEQRDMEDGCHWRC